MNRSDVLRLSAVLMIIVAATACRRDQPEANAPAGSAPAVTSEARTDENLTTAVQARYYTDDTIRARQIDVSAENGVITLRGTVPSEAAKQQAVDLAQQVEGVARVEDELVVQTPSGEGQTASGPQPAAGAGATGTTGENGDSDADAGAITEASTITMNIRSRYFRDPDIKPWTIDVSTTGNGVVTLQGTVDNEGSKAEALRIAREVPGVARVEDRITVSPNARPAGEKPGQADEGATGTATADAASPLSDAWLTAKIQARYFVDSDVKARNIDVDTNEGTVTLRGTVQTEAERRQALTIARNVEGVRNVTDELRVEAPSDTAETADGGPAAAAEPLPDVKPIQRPDAWVTMKIQSKYFLDTDVKGREIDVDTQNGVVTLKGSVETAGQSQTAEQIARETEGVKKVVNQLTVSGPTGG
ncbi:MAG TPA: BON domain-containing protein [Vicinamibacterales bacterium]|nr:BON domain-containing protein [Vicinamibacterales bacterium]